MNRGVQSLRRLLTANKMHAFCIAVQGSFVGIIIKGSAGSRKVTELLFAFDFVKINQENWCPRSMAVC